MSKSLKLIAFASIAAALAAAPALAAPVVSRTAAVTPSAVAVQPSPAFLQRANDMLDVYNGKQRMRPLLSEAAAAKSKVSLDDTSVRVEKMFGKFRKRAGPALGVSHVVARTPYEGDVFVNLQKTQVRMRLSLDTQAPHQVQGFGLSTDLSAAATESR
jgi:hypothetical protein